MSPTPTTMDGEDATPVDAPDEAPPPPRGPVILVVVMTVFLMAGYATSLRPMIPTVRAGRCILLGKSSSRLLPLRTRE